MKTFKDVYKLPFEKYIPEDTWVYDQNNNFCFQFEIYRDDINDKFLEVINGKRKIKDKNILFEHKEGYITTNKGKKVILIRGWGNLTSPNCLNLSPEEASNVQDTLAEYIVEKLNER